MTDLVSLSSSQEKKIGVRVALRKYELENTDNQNQMGICKPFF